MEGGRGHKTLLRTFQSLSSHVNTDRAHFRALPCKTGRGDSIGPRDTRRSCFCGSAKIRVIFLQSDKPQNATSNSVCFFVFFCKSRFLECWHWFMYGECAKHKAPHVTLVFCHTCSAECSFCPIRFHLACYSSIRSVYTTAISDLVWVYLGKRWH